MMQMLSYATQKNISMYPQKHYKFYFLPILYRDGATLMYSMYVVEESIKANRVNIRAKRELFGFVKKKRVVWKGVNGLAGLDSSRR